MIKGQRRALFYRMLLFLFNRERQKSAVGFVVAHKTSRYGALIKDPSKDYLSQHRGRVLTIISSPIHDEKCKIFLTCDREASTGSKLLLIMDIHLKDRKLLYPWFVFFGLLIALLVVVMALSNCLISSILYTCFSSSRSLFSTLVQSKKLSLQTVFCQSSQNLTSSCVSAPAINCSTFAKQSFSKHFKYIVDTSSPRNLIT